MGIFYQYASDYQRLRIKKALHRLCGAFVMHLFLHEIIMIMIGMIVADIG